ENGAVEKGSCLFSARAAYVEFQRGESIGLLECPPVGGIDRDFLGSAMPANTVRPGPFQKLAGGVNRIAIRPIRT
ncbi:MAG: hypothetical protein WCH98_23205, partial [Verrucomicrobiota bacterium]